MTIPVGLDCISGGLITLTTELINLPAGCMAIFEDRTLKLYTDLNVPGASYEVVLAANTSGTGRFFLNLFDPGIIGITTEDLKNLNVFAIGK